MEPIDLVKEQDLMIQEQIINRGIKDKVIIDAFYKVKRHLFVKPNNVEEAYNDYPLDIGYSQTISQPYIVAFMMEKLNIKSSDRVLEIGTGSGYQTALLSLLAKEVYTIEILKPLQEEARKRLDKQGYSNIYYKHGNGYSGWIENCPYDKIIVSCASSYLPTELINQLTNKGEMIIPVGNSFWQDLYLVSKDNILMNKKSLGRVRFVPMVE